MKSIIDRKTQGIRIRLAFSLLIIAALAAASESFAYTAGNIVVSSFKNTMTEGERDTVYLQLEHIGVVVEISSSNDDVVINPTRVFHTHQNANDKGGTPFTITIKEDADLLDETATITLLDIGHDNPHTLTLNIIDNDPVPGTIQVSPADWLTIDEGRSGILEVSLDTAATPVGDTRVSLSKTNPDLTLSPTSLIFTASNYSTVQRVTVSARGDADTTDDRDTITLRSSGGISAPSVTRRISITDKTSPPRIQVAPAGAMTIAEGGSGTLSVNLSAAPSGNVRIALSSSNPGITFSPTYLNFTPSNYAARQSVQVSARRGADFGDGSVSISLDVRSGPPAPRLTKTVIVSGDASSGNIVFSPSGTLTIVEGGRKILRVGLESSIAPKGNVTVVFTTVNPDIVITPSYLTFTASNHSIAQSIQVSAKEDADSSDESASITAVASGGIVAPLATQRVSITDNDSAPPPGYNYEGRLVIVPDGPLAIDEEGKGTIEVSLSAPPSEALSVAIETTDDSAIELSRESMSFTPSNWDQAQSLVISALADSDDQDDSYTIEFTLGGRSIGQEIIVRDKEGDAPDGELPRAQALALPSAESGDDMTLRIQCKQDSPCSVAFDCSAQADGSLFRGRLQEAIPAFGAVSLTARDIEAYTGGNSWAGKGRLECTLRSNGKIASQVWTRSGDGVLVNNSARIQSAKVGEVYRADIESIPSPDSLDESNIRIHCNSDSGDCWDTVFECYLDDGTGYDWNLGNIPRRTTRHLQSEALAAGIGYRWPGLGLACEIRSRGMFTAQVLTRTGNGALINNSATGG
ncbi:MAG: hypothetical protein ISN28_02710 [Ectothiorhodospiraceae bacterium AqS1]|nr:hypothetical protein [Ectothiorhodospiraceae bacterium AqS1]